MGTNCYTHLVRIISRRTLRVFWEKRLYRDSELPLRAWFGEAKRAKWLTPQDVKDQYRSASILGDGRVVFNVGGNKYRLIVAARYDLGILFIRFIGTHRQYDRINAEEV